jgi:hypothetical protein
MRGEVGAFAEIENDEYKRQVRYKWNPPAGIPLGFQLKLRILKSAENKGAYWGIGLTSKPRQTTNAINGDLMKVSRPIPLILPANFNFGSMPFGLHDNARYDEEALYFSTAESFASKYHYIQLFFGDPQYLVSDFAVWTNVPLEGREIRIVDDHLKIQ